MSQLTILNTYQCTLWGVCFLSFLSLLVTLPLLAFHARELPIIALPSAVRHGNVPLESALAGRKSSRTFSHSPLDLQEVAQLLWAAQGINDQGARRTVPSAGALYPLEIYLAASQVQDLDPAIYHYLPRPHALRLLRSGDIRDQLAAAALHQSCVRTGAACLVITTVNERTERRYGSRAERYSCMESGHAAQNVYLQAQALGLGTVAVGAFEDDLVHRLLGLRHREFPRYLMPVGKLPLHAG